MKQELKGFSKIFAFTFTHHVGRSSYKTTLLTVALLCLLVPALVMTGIEYFDSRDGGTPEPNLTGVSDGMEYAEGASPEDMEAAQGEASAVDLSALQNILVVEQFSDEGSLAAGEVQAAGGFTAEGFGSFSYEEAGADLSGVSFTEYGGDLGGACQAAKGTGDTLILVVAQQGNEYVLNLLLPEGSTLDEEVAYGLEPLLSAYADGVVGSANAAVMDAGDGNGPDGAAGDAAGDTEEDEASDMHLAKMVLGYVIPYLNIMVLYFFVLFYGQGVAQSVIMEKTSKLMDVFLISVRPAAMILGKVTAICLAGVIELAAWILCLCGGFALGRLGVLAINSESDMFLVQLLDGFGSMASGMFSVSGIIVALLIMVAGMLLYCAIAGVGGAIAGKPEDLSSTNILFTLILVASFFANLLAGGLDGLESGSEWLDWIPFTSIMITPARVMLGSVSIIKGLGCLAIVLVTAVLFSLLAGKLYKLMALYKGDVPGPKQMAEMLRQNR